MKFINETKNTVYLHDIDKHITYQGDEPQEIDADTILKSHGFQKLVEIGKFRIVSIGSSRIEKNLLRIQKMKIVNAHPVVTENQHIATDLEVLIKGHFLEAGGYAKVNRNLALGLQKLGVNVKVDIVGGTKSELTAQEMKSILRLRGKPSRNAIRLDSVVPTFGVCSPGKHKILYTTVEAHSVPDQFIEAANIYDEVWVTSNFCADILTKSGLAKPVFVLPDSIDTSLYTEEGEEYEFQPSLSNHFVFVSVFGWSYRKGYDVLLKAYLREFSGDDPVTLLLVSRFQNRSSNRQHIKDEVSSYIRQYGGDNPPNIVRCSKVIPEHQMPSLYRACDAFVLFTRGEGFSLCYPEASLCGLPIIGTNCSGQTMFLNHQNSYLLEPDRFAKMPPGKMHVHYWDNQVFPVLTSDEVIDEAGGLMRAVYEDVITAVKKNDKLQKWVRENYPIETVAQKAKDQLLRNWRP